jgi:hypothetical protein
MRRTPQSRATRDDVAAWRSIAAKSRSTRGGQAHDIDFTRPPHGVLVEQVAAHHLGVAGPRDVAQFRGAPGSARRRPRPESRQPAADVAGGAGDEMSHGSMLPRGGRVGMSTDEVGPSQARAVPGRPGRGTTVGYRSGGPRHRSGEDGGRPGRGDVTNLSVCRRFDARNPPDRMATRARGR